MNRFNKAMLSVAAASTLLGCDNSPEAKTDVPSEQSQQGESGGSVPVCAPYTDGLEQDQFVLVAIGESEWDDDFANRVSDGNIPSTYGAVIDLVACPLADTDDGLVVGIEELPLEDSGNPSIKIDVSGKIDNQRVEVTGCYVTGIVIEEVYNDDGELVELFPVTKDKEQLIEAICLLSSAGY